MDSTSSSISKVIEVAWTQKAMDEFANTKIDRAINIIQDAWLGVDEDVMFKGKLTNTIFMHMIDQLKKLKSNEGRENKV